MGKMKKYRKDERKTAKVYTDESIHLKVFLKAQNTSSMLILLASVESYVYPHSTLYGEMGILITHTASQDTAH